MKIYTKTGDQGQTSLIGGTRVPKHHIRIETYGMVDELNSYIGMIRDLTRKDDHLNFVLNEIQDRLFTIGSNLAADPEKSRMKLPDLHESDVTLLEKEIDRMNESLPELKNFILPGGDITASWCHLARCVCRRCERLVTQLSEKSDVQPIIIVYLNRLSDYLFVLARKILLQVRKPEINWKPRI